MSRYQKPFTLMGAVLLGLPFMCQFGYAAKPMDLRHENLSIFQSFASPANHGVKIEETTRNVDFNHTLHIRVQETYLGHLVWGADAVIHVPQGGNHLSLNAAMKHPNVTMNGILYSELKADLGNVPSGLLMNEGANKALDYAISTYEHKVGNKAAIQNAESKLIVFIDQNNKAHWAYKVKFDVTPSKAGAIPQRPTYIIDAKTSAIYVQWDDIKTAESTDISGGGFGGNKKMGKLVYDGMDKNLPKLGMVRDEKSQTCYLKNDHVTVKHYRTKKVISFACKSTNPDHNNVYWDGDLDAVNEGYSPSNDALFGGAVIDGMYQKWYGVPVLIDNGKPMMLNMVVHNPIDNAYWDGRQMTFGDGVRMFYPLTSLGVAAHEISHGFTQQHSNLAYYGQSGGMNEAFSDMAAQAAEFFAYGKNSWQIGPEIFKAEDEALRYMDKPSKDCEGKRKPGNWCSIDEVSQYYSGLDVHFSSGIYNRVFYLIGTAKGWDTKKAFDVMVQANSNYWTSSTSFKSGACDVLTAAKDLSYDNAAIIDAFKVVGVDTSKC